MKKVMISLLFVAIAAFVFTSCASSKRSGYGCPTSTSNRPFRA
nr:hypothetical protein [uncultured Lacibacter sp.]